jgi:hypothetical protein
MGFSDGLGSTREGRKVGWRKTPERVGNTFETWLKEAEEESEDE